MPNASSGGGTSLAEDLAAAAALAERMDLTVGGSNAERSNLALPTATPVEGGALPGAECGQKASLTWAEARGAPGPVRRPEAPRRRELTPLTLAREVAAEARRARS